MKFNKNCVRIIDYKLSEKEVELLRSDLEEFIQNEIPCYPKDYYRGKGIVYTAGGISAVTCLWISINILRESGCNLDIEIWHLGNEISPEIIAKFEHLNVNFKNIYDYKDIAFPGYFLKPLAIHLSRFAEVLFLDADNICLKNPEYLFNNILYKNSGAVFWPDYWITDHNNPIWKITKSSDYQALEQESGQILINKKKCWKELQTTLYFNKLNKFYYKLLHGDKDTFKFGWISNLKEFYMIPYYPAICGKYIEDSFYGTTIVQYDIEHNILFLHRNLIKWDLTLDNESFWEHIKIYSTQQSGKEVFFKKYDNKYLLDFGDNSDLIQCSNEIKELEKKCMILLKSWRSSKEYANFLDHMHKLRYRFNLKSTLNLGSCYQK